MTTHKYTPNFYVYDANFRTRYDSLYFFYIILNLNRHKQRNTRMLRLYIGIEYIILFQKYE